MNGDIFKSVTVTGLPYSSTELPDHMVIIQLLQMCPHYNTLKWYIFEDVESNGDDFQSVRLPGLPDPASYMVARL